MSVHVIILAQGSQRRLPDLAFPKHVLPLPACRNTALLHRTLQMLWRIYADCHVTLVASRQLRTHLPRPIVGTDGEFHTPDFITLQDPGNSSLKGIAKFLQGADAVRAAIEATWGDISGVPPLLPFDMTVVLLGDVVYSWRCFARLFTDSAAIRFVGSHNLSPSDGEL